SSVQFNEGNHDVVDESKMETDNGNSSRKRGKIFSDKGAAAPKAEVAYQLNAGSRKRKQKSFTLKNDETHTGSHLSGSQKIKPTLDNKHFQSLSLGLVQNSHHVLSL
ncbi:protein always early 3-like, partial [Trifolium medium]|nr:protein always early 3-like [Trifolium medium]